MKFIFNSFFKFSLLFLFQINPLFALEAVVKVLEAPVFSKEEKNSKVVEYRKKGEVIKIFPQKKILFLSDSDVEIFLEKNEFIPIIDKSGQKSYILANHLFILFENSQEFQETARIRDDTDYRLNEPLPTSYPLGSSHTHRSQITLGLNHFIFENYPYPEDYSRKGFLTQSEFVYSLFKMTPPSFHQRLFWGGHLSYKTHSNSFYFLSKRRADEKGHKLGIGPSVMYDAYKANNHQLSILGNLSYIFYETLFITQQTSEQEESKRFWGQSLSLSFTPQWQIKHFLGGLDLILGAKMEYVMGSYLRTKEKSRYPIWWRSTGEEKFWTKPSVNLGFFCGLQSFY